MHQASLKVETDRGVAELQFIAFWLPQYQAVKYQGCPVATSNSKRSTRTVFCIIITEWVFRDKSITNPSRKSNSSVHIDHTIDRRTPSEDRRG